MASFQHHLTALSAEFERLVIENSELKKQFPKEASPDVAAKCQTNAWQAPHTVETWLNGMRIRLRSYTKDE